MAFYDFQLAGYWNAATNDRGLKSGKGIKGQIYQVSVAGTTSLDGYSSWAVDDLAFFNEDRWTKILGGNNFGITGFIISPELFAGSDTTKIQSAIDTLNAIGGGIVILARVYSTGDLTMKSNVKLLGTGAGGLRRSSGAALGAFISFATASNAALNKVDIDGNRGVVNPDSNAQLIDLGSGNDNRVEDCNIHDTIGTGIIVRTGLRPIVLWNRVINCGAVGIAIFPGTGVITETNGEVAYNTISAPGQHAILALYSNNLKIHHNWVYGVFVNGSVVNIDTAAKTITWVSGTNFANVLEGNFCIFNGNTQELHIDDKISNTVLHYDTVWVHANVAGATAAFGTGDLINLQSCINPNVHDNQIADGVGCGVVIWDDGTNFSFRNTVRNNTAKGIGSSGFTCQGVSAAKNMSHAFTNNLSYNCGLNGAAGHPSFNTGLTISVADKVFVQGNETFGDSGSMTNGVLLFGVPTGGAVVRGNGVMGVTDGKNVPGAIISIVPSAGWGSTAAVTLIVCDGESLTFTLTPGGAGIAITPNVIVNKAVVGTQSVQVTMQDAFSGTVVPGYIISNSDTAIQFQLTGVTPVAGRAYVMNVRL